MASSRRGVLVKLSGAFSIGFVGMDILDGDLRSTNRILRKVEGEIKGERTPEARVSKSISVSPAGFRMLPFELTHPILEYTLNVETGAVQTWLTKPSSDENGTSFSSNVGCNNDAAAGETRTTRCELDEGEYTLVVKSDAEIESSLELTIEFYER